MRGYIGSSEVVLPKAKNKQKNKETETRSEGEITTRRERGMRCEGGNAWVLKWNTRVTAGVIAG